MTPEETLEELRKLHWSKEEWLADDKKRKNFPNSVEVKKRERDALASAIDAFEKWCKKRADNGQAK